MSFSFVARALYFQRQNRFGGDIMSKKHLYEVIQAAQTEEELKFLFVNHFDLPISTKNRIDLYTEQILYEFKFNVLTKTSKKINRQDVLPCRFLFLGSFC